MTQHYKETYPNADAVNGLIERAGKLSAAEAEKLATAWDAVGVAAWEPAWEEAVSAAWGLAQGTPAGIARSAAWRAVRNAKRGLAWGAAEDAAEDAALAAVVRDLISDQHYQALAGPWESVMGPVFREES